MNLIYGNFRCAFVRFKWCIIFWSEKIGLKGSVRACDSMGLKLGNFTVFRRIFQIVLHLKWTNMNIINELVMLKLMLTNGGILFSIHFDSFSSQAFILMSRPFIFFRFKSSHWMSLHTEYVDGCGFASSETDELALVFLFRSCNVTCGLTNMPSSSFCNWIII